MLTTASNSEERSFSCINTEANVLHITFCFSGELCFPSVIKISANRLILDCFNANKEILLHISTNLASSLQQNKCHITKKKNSKNQILWQYNLPRGRDGKIKNTTTWTILQLYIKQKLYIMFLTQSLTKRDKVNFYCKT